MVFVFATTEVHKIPVTILSRCQRFDFKLISTARLADHLAGILRAEKIDAAPEAVRLVARQAAGSVRDGLSLLDQAIAYVGAEPLTAEVTAEVLGIADRRLLVELAGAVLDHDAASALRLVARAADRGVDFGELGRSFLTFLRDLEVVARVKDAKGGTDLDALVDATPEEIDELVALVARATPGLVPVLFDRWARAVDEASRAQTPRILYEMAAVDLVRGRADGPARRFCCSGSTSSRRACAGARPPRAPAQPPRAPARPPRASARPPRASARPPRAPPRRFPWRRRRRPRRPRAPGAGRRRPRRRSSRLRPPSRPFRLRGKSFRTRPRFGDRCWPGWRSSGRRWGR